MRRILRITQKEILNSSKFWLIFAICLLIFSLGLFLTKLNDFLEYRDAADLSAKAPSPVILETPEREAPIDLPAPKPLLTEPPEASSAPAESSEEQTGWTLIDGKSGYIDENGDPLTGLCTVEGKLYYFSPDGAKAESIGVDISSYNGAVNWQLVRENGIDFAIIRVGGRRWGKGQLYEDGFTLKNLLDARKAGIKVGLYFYSTAVNIQEAREEALYAVRRLRGIRLDLPIFFDSEHSGDYPEGRADLLTSAERTELARAFSDTVEACGYEAGIYAGLLFLYQNLYYHALWERPIWLANYTKELQLPDFLWRYDIWQCSASAKVSGVSGQMDLNIIF